jgi:hypothetical protein
MEWGIIFLDDLQRMKEKMDRTWKDLFEEIPEDKERDTQGSKRLSRFEWEKEAFRNRH